MEKKETFAQELSALLVENEIVSLEEGKALQKAFKDSSKESFDDFLLEEGLVEEADLLKTLADYYKVPAFDVVGYFFSSFLLKKFPKGFLLRNALIPLEVDENMMIIVASEPNDPELLAKIGEYVSYDIRFRVGLRRDICDAVKEFYDKSVTEVPEDFDLESERGAGGGDEDVEWEIFEEEEESWD